MAEEAKEDEAVETAINAEVEEAEPALKKALSIVKSKSKIASPEEEEKSLAELAQELKEKKEKGKMIKDENNEEIKITWDCYKQYVGGYFGGWGLLFMSNLAMILLTACSIGSDIVIGDWTS